MKKAASDTKVKKTLVRNPEIRVKPSARKPVVYDVACSSGNTKSSRSSQKENEFSSPSLCSTEMIANYLSEAKKPVPQVLTEEDLNANREQMNLKMTKKLNFHFNDRMYKNLVELNASIESSKIRRDKCIPSVATIKRDLEPNIDDFNEEEKEIDTPPAVSVLRPKFKPIKKVENGRLHRLVAALEDL